MAPAAAPGAAAGGQPAAAASCQWGTGASRRRGGEREWTSRQSAFQLWTQAAHWRSGWKLAEGSPPIVVEPSGSESTRTSDLGLGDVPVYGTTSEVRCASRLRGRANCDARGMHGACNVNRACHCGTAAVMPDTEIPGAGWPVGYVACIGNAAQPQAQVWALLLSLTGKLRRVTG